MLILYTPIIAQRDITSAPTSFNLAFVTRWTKKNIFQKSLHEYQALTQEYKDNYQSFSKKERDRINQALGKYAGILLKKGISSAGNVLQEAIDGASSFLKGVFESDESED